MDVSKVDRFAFYLDRRTGFKFEGLGLSVLQINLQNIRQEEQRVALQTTQGSGVR